MVPESLNNFFLASAGIGATLVGLIFVAVSIAPEQIVQANAPIERRAMAASSFTALLNAFFISFAALIPGAIGYLTLLMSALGITSSSLLAWNLLQDRERWQTVLRRIFLIVVSLVLYGFEVYNAILIVREPKIVGNYYALAGLLIGVYGVGLTRAWQLLGARRFRLGIWLSPLLHELNETKPIRTQDESGTPGKIAHDD